MSWSDIPGWFGFANTYDKMVDTAKHGDVIVEVGVAFGRSLAYLSRKVIDSGKRIQIYAVDPWLDRGWNTPADEGGHPGWGGEYTELVREKGGPFNAFLHCMTTHAPAELERVNVLRCTSKDASRIISGCHGVLIDASHHYEDVQFDIHTWLPHLNVNGILAGDDYSTVFPGVMQAVGEEFGIDGFYVDGTTWVRK